MNRRFYLPWTLFLPIVILLSAGLFAIAMQRIAKWSYHREIKQLVAADEPIDAASLRARFFQSTSQTQTVDRIDVTMASNATSYASNVEIWPVENYAPQPLRQALVSLGEPWPQRVLMEHYVNERRTILAELTRLAKSSQPTWHYRSLSRQDTVVSSAGWATWETLLLDAEFLLAVHDDDSDRALQALEVHDSTIRSNDWQVNISEDLQRITARHHQCSRIIESMQLRSFWSTEQLDRLETLLSVKQSLGQRWRRVLSGERAMSLDAIDANSGWLSGTVDDLFNLSPFLSKSQRTIPASTLVRFVRRLNDLVSLADLGYSGLVFRAQSNADWQANEMMRWAPIGFARLNYSQKLEALRPLTPAVGIYANHLVDLEDARRLARIAIALRRYITSNGRWPTKLSELQRFGVTDSDLQTTDNSPFTMQPTDASTFQVSFNPKVLNTPPLACAP